MSAVRGRRQTRAAKIQVESRQKTLRKSLSLLQPAADSSTTLVGYYGPTSSQKVGILKPAASTKENSPMKTRRSKRNAASSAQVSKVKSSTPIGNATKSAETFKLEQQTLEKYSVKSTDKLPENDFVVREENHKEPLDQHEKNLSGISIPSESSGYFSDILEKHEGDLEADVTITAPDATDAEMPKSDCVAASEGLQDDVSAGVPQDLYDILCGGKASESYWKSLAEQRQLALEETLRENELLQDQLEVLEAENSRLQSLVDDAKKLAEIVQDVVGE